MGEAFVVHGDPVAAVIDILENHTPELDVYDVVRISGSLTDWVSPQRWILVSREGGLKQWPKIDKPRVDIEVYGEDSQVVSDICSIAEASIMRMQYRYKGYGVRVHRVVEEVGFVEAYDKFAESPRYIFSLRLTTTPDPLTTPSLGS